MGLKAFCLQQGVMVCACACWFANWQRECFSPSRADGHMNGGCSGQSRSHLEDSMTELHAARQNCSRLAASENHKGKGAPVFNQVGVIALLIVLLVLVLGGATAR